MSNFKTIPNLVCQRKYDQLYIHWHFKGNKNLIKNIQNTLTLSKLVMKYMRRMGSVCDKGSLIAYANYLRASFQPKPEWHNYAKTLWTVK